MHQKYLFLQKLFPRGLNVKKSRIFINSLKFPVLHDNIFYRYILCVTCLSVPYTVLSYYYIFF